MALLWFLILLIALVALFIGGLMLMSSRKGREIELIEPGDLMDAKKGREIKSKIERKIS